MVTSDNHRDQEPSRNSVSPAKNIVAVIVANTSLIIAILVYMGFAYDDALYGYFHIRPLDLGVGILEYMLRSLSLFSPTIVIVAAVAILLSSLPASKIHEISRIDTLMVKVRSSISAIPVLRAALASPEARRLARRRVMTYVGAALTLLGLGLFWLASYAQISTFLILGLLGTGPLVLAWPNRVAKFGRFPYALAVVTVAVCTLWAASLYAHALGLRTASEVVRTLNARTAVAVYSVYPLALSGPGVTVQHLPPGFLYHYRYEGLRLLIMRSGTYYLLPVGWKPQLDITYVIANSSQTRIELYSGVTYLK